MFGYIGAWLSTYGRDGKYTQYFTKPKLYAFVYNPWTKYQGESVVAMTEVSIKKGDKLNGRATSPTD